MSNTTNDTRISEREAGWDDASREIAEDGWTQAGAAAYVSMLGEAEDDYSRGHDSRMSALALTGA